jgi:hypothetical protein
LSGVNQMYEDEMYYEMCEDYYTIEYLKEELLSNTENFVRSVLEEVWDNIDKDYEYLHIIKNISRHQAWSFSQKATIVSCLLQSVESGHLLTVYERMLNNTDDWQV